MPDQLAPVAPLSTWPDGLTRVPFQAYRDAAVYEAEQGRLFEGPVWNFLCLEVDIPNPGDWRTTFVGRCRWSSCATTTARSRAFENRCAHRGALICLDDGGNGARTSLRLSRLALRPVRQPAVGRVPARRERQGRHAGGLRHGERTARASCAPPRSAAWCSARCRTRRAGHRRLSSARTSLARARRVLTKPKSRSSAASPRCCRTTGSSMPRTCATPTTPACCTCSSPPSASPG